MERRKRERSRSPVDSRVHYREKYSRERDKDRHGRKDTDHERDNTKASFHDRGETEHKSRNDARERERRERRYERHNLPRREEYEERNNRHGSNRERYNDERKVNRRDNERTSWPCRDRSRERVTQRNDEEQEGHRRDRRHDFRRNRDEVDEHRGQRRPGYRGGQRGHRRYSDNEPDDSSRYGQPAGEQGTTEAAVEAEKPNFGLSGKLTEYTNTYKGVVIKYNEPPEGRKPKTRWRLYPFKGEEGLPVLYIHRQSAYLLGRQRHIADIPIDHPSCSKQHAVLQYRLAPYERSDGTSGRKVKPYIIDLESANGTFLNNQKIDPRRYYELKERDVLKFGFSSREYVILHERSSNTAEEGTENTDEAAGSGSDASSGDSSDASSGDSPE